MDIKSMHQEELYGKTDENIVPKHKVYCILIIDGWVYFPIAAQMSPYIRRNGQRVESYLAEMPNFFGGNKNVQGGVWEDDCTALIREIEEESQGNIQVQISEEILEELFSEVDQNGNTFRFCLARVDKRRIRNFNWQGQTAFRLCSYEKGGQDARQHPERYEDGFLVRMEEKYFWNFVHEIFDMQDIGDGKERRRQVAALLLRQGINGGALGVDNWYRSHTANAFLNYLLKNYPAFT